MLATYSKKKGAGTCSQLCCIASYLNVSSTYIKRYQFCDEGKTLIVLYVHKLINCFKAGMKERQQMILVVLPWTKFD